MRKSMIALVATGLGGCLLTTVLMGHLLSMEPDMRLTGKIAEDFASAFRAMSDKDAALVVKRPPKDELLGDTGTSVRIVARIWPKPSVDVERMIEDVAGYVWRQDFGDPIQELQVRWKDPKSGGSERRIVGRPGRKRVLRLYGSGASR